ncbi:MAG: hypothetical protein XD73_0067 [Anaerolinea thermophila]|uniref:PD-(D/E)XK endonuclease-like domain-containing protein n=1 Tax=Anaerolinea thermophila TaxID=167964 RepID=A0A101FZ67_9CHLR|nr:MAG: hypothetical protein XD73_0067 [Anaerolinea thermophila]
MPAMPDFRFSAQSLQDYVECQRRFELRYIQKLDWPAEESSPYLEFEQFRQKGNLFHQCVNQYFHHLAPQVIEKQIEDQEVLCWWQNFLAFIATQSFTFSTAETLFQTHIGGYPVVAKYDLLVLQKDGNYTIFDWKTTAREQKPKRSAFIQKMQTIIYPYVLSQCRFGHPDRNDIEPVSITLIYWFPQFPEQPETFPYSTAQQVQDEKMLADLIHEIVIKPTGDFALVEDEKRCRFCVYRSYCGRGEKAGSMYSADANLDMEFSDMDLDIENVEEIRY